MRAAADSARSPGETVREIFLCNVDADREVAATVRRALEAAAMDVTSPADVAPGEPFTAAIQAQIDAADAVVILLSTASIAEEQIWIEAAAAIAAQARDPQAKQVVPILLEPDLEPPSMLARLQALQLFAGGRETVALQELVSTLAAGPSELSSSWIELELKALQSESDVLARQRFDLTRESAAAEWVLRSLVVAVGILTLFAGILAWIGDHAIVPIAIPSAMAGAAAALLGTRLIRGRT